MSQNTSDPHALLEMISRLDGMIGELKDGGQALSAQLVSMARLELMMTLHQISEQEMGALRSMVEDKQRTLS